MSEAEITIIHDLDWHGGKPIDSSIPKCIVKITLKIFDTEIWHVPTDSFLKKLIQTMIFVDKKNIENLQNPESCFSSKVYGWLKESENNGN